MEAVVKTYSDSNQSGEAVRETWCHNLVKQELETCLAMSSRACHRTRRIVQERVAYVMEEAIAAFGSVGSL
jgi:hypothetical protein